MDREFKSLSFNSLRDLCRELELEITLTAHQSDVDSSGFASCFSCQLTKRCIVPSQSALGASAGMLQADTLATCIRLAQTCSNV